MDLETRWNVETAGEERPAGKRPVSSVEAPNRSSYQLHSYLLQRRLTGDFPQAAEEDEESAGPGPYFWRTCLVLVGIFFVTTMYTIVFSKLMPPTGHRLLDAVRGDVYYCYLFPLTLYPSFTALYLSWVSMKFFRHN